MKSFAYLCIVKQLKHYIMIHDLSTQKGRNAYAEAMSTKKFNHIPMFKDSCLTKSWAGFMEDDWMVEVKGDKARVYSNSPFVKKPSRFAKLIPIGKEGNLRVYQLTVNGNKAFFKIAYITDHEKKLGFVPTKNT